MRRTVLKTLISAPLAVSAAAAVICLAPGTASAAHGAGANGKPSGGGSTGSSITMRVVSGPDSVPNWGEQVTFNVSTTATTEPHVDLTCSQNGTLVYSATTGYYASYPWPWTQTMTLSSNAWTGGAASCSARLYAFARKGTTTLATMSFQAYA